MERGLPTHRSFQQTIPSMMRMRDERTQSNHSPLRTVMDNAVVTYQAQSLPSSTRMNPYKVPFQRRQLIEPVYADPAPLVMPQAVQLSSAFGLGGIFAGANGIFMPNVQRNMIEIPLIPHSNNTSNKEETDFYTTGLTSSPPNHSIPDRTTTQFKKPETSSLNDKVDLDKDANRIKTTETKQQINFEPPNTGMRVLTGSVEKIIKWEKMWADNKDKPSLLFEVIAPLLQINEGIRQNEKQLLLRESGGPVLTVMYYEIDQLTPKFNRGQYVRCICRSLGKRRFQAFSVRSASQQEHSSLQRISFLCQRAVQEALLAIPEP